MKKVLIAALLGAFTYCTDSAVDNPQSGPVEEGEGTAIVYLPAIPADFLSKALAEGRLELAITGPAMEPIVYSWAFSAMPAEPVYVRGIPAGSPRVFTGRLFDSRGFMTHKGEVATAVRPGETVEVTLRLSRLSGSAIVCVEIEGLPGSCEPVAPERGLVAYYPLDGNARDASGMGNNGTVHGAQPAVDRFGRPGAACLFDGDDYVEVPYHSSLDCERSVSLTAWAKSDLEGREYAADGVIAQMGFAAEEAYYVGYHRGTNSMIGVYRNHWGWTAAGEAVDYDGGLHSPIPLDKAWHFYAITFDGDSLRLYVDTRLVGTIVAYPGPIRDTPLRIGAQAKSLARYFHGSIDEVRVYNRPLSALEISAVARR
jgi:hypothetical protein